ncbi:MAG: GDP-mannose 4,6-dehydratase, partial [Candidatus Margulisiibacteriota bacterium]
ILDIKSVYRAFDNAQYDFIFHLAGASSVKESFNSPQLYINTNIAGGVNLLETAKNKAPQAKILLVTSGEIYGEALSKDQITTEESRIMPKSPYAVSKAALDMFGRVYALASGLKVVIARPFNHIGPRQSDVFFVPTAAKQIAEIMKGVRAKKLTLGNLDVFRDFTDVRDIVNAYVLLIEKGKYGESYNICSGKRYLLKDIIDRLIGISNEKIEIVIDPEKCRKADLIDMKIDNSKLIKETEWRPDIDINRSLKDILTYWEQKI